MPNPLWTKRWKGFSMQNLTEWASERVRTIHITQGLGTTSYELEVREFIPKPDDLMEKFWTVEGVRKSAPATLFAIVDLEKAAKSRLQFLNDNVGAYITSNINNSDILIRTTYERAMRHAQEAPVSFRDALQ